MRDDSPPSLSDLSGNSTDALATVVQAHSTRTSAAQAKDFGGAPSAVGSVTLNQRPQLGTVIQNRFELEAVLGSGGMGCVYRAIDRRKQEARDANPTVAIKVLTGKVAQHPDAFIALQRETRKAQQLAHPNIVTVYDFDRDGDRAYMTMEVLNGATLDACIEQYPEGLPRAQANALLAGIMAGLAYAHSKGFVHADLKPSNVFVCDDGQVKLLDFGIARAVSHAGTPEHTTVFEPGHLGGLTPSYASLALFESEPATPADDIYALGLIAYELHTGRHPYERQSARVIDSTSATTGASQIATVARPAQLKPREWRALRNAIAVTRVPVFESVAAFRLAYEGRPRLRLGAFLAALLVLMSVLVTVWVTPPQREQAVALNSLPPPIQARVRSHLGQAQEALRFNDINAALFHLNSVTELHAHNPTALAQVDELVEAALERIEPLTDDEELRQLTQLLTHPILRNHRLLLQRARDLGLAL